MANNTPKQYTAEKDVTRKTPDGREIVVARKGASMPYAQAEKMGLVGDGEPQAIGTFDTPVGNLSLMRQAESKENKGNEQLQASIEEVTAVQETGERPEKKAKAKK